jgi:hypothetical protein
MSQPPASNSHDPRDLRARIAWAGLRIYQIAPAVGLHPCALGQMLNGHLPLRRDVAERIAWEIDQATTAKA